MTSSVVPAEPDFQEAQYESIVTPYTKKSVHFLSRKRTVAVMSRGQRVIIAKKSKQHTGGFILKKSTET